MHRTTTCAPHMRITTRPVCCPEVRSGHSDSVKQQPTTSAASPINQCLLRFASILSSLSLRAIRLRCVFLRIMKRPSLVRLLQCVNPKKSSVSGRRSPRFALRSAAYLPNSIRRVFSSWSLNPNLPKRSFNSDWILLASFSCSNPSSVSSA